MMSDKKKTGIDELLDTAEGLRDVVIEGVKQKVFQTIDPQLSEFILKELQEEANTNMKKKLREEFEEDFEDPTPEEDEEFEIEDSPDIESGSEAEEVSEDGDVDVDNEPEITDPIPTEDDEESGEFETLQIKINGREFQAEYSEGDNKIVFKAADAPEETGLEGEEGGEEMPPVEGGEGDVNIEMPAGEDEEVSLDLDSDDEMEPELYEDEDEEDELKFEVLNRLRKKSGSKKPSEKELLESFRNEISERLRKKLATNIHETKQKPKRKVSIQEHLENRNLSPQKLDQRETLTEQETKDFHNRISELLDL